MTWHAPDAWPALILALAAFRLTRLAGWDDLTIRPRRWLTGLGDDEHKKWASWIEHEQERGADPWQHGAPPPVGPRRYYLSKLIRCPWCVGFWIALLVTIAYVCAGGYAVLAGMPFALSAVVGLVAKHLDP